MTLIQEEGISKVKPSLESVYLSSSISSGKEALESFGYNPFKSNTKLEAQSSLLFKQTDNSSTVFLWRTFGLTALQFWAEKEMSVFEDDDFGV